MYGFILLVSFSSKRWRKQLYIYKYINTYGSIVMLLNANAKYNINCNDGMSTSLSTIAGTVVSADSSVWCAMMEIGIGKTILRRFPCNCRALPVGTANLRSKINRRNGTNHCMLSVGKHYMLSIGITQPESKS